MAAENFLATVDCLAVRYGIDPLDIVRGPVGDYSILLQIAKAGGAFKG